MVCLLNIYNGMHGHLLYTVYRFETTVLSWKKKSQFWYVYLYKLAFHSSEKTTFLYLLYLKQLQMYEDPNPWIGDDWTQIKFGLGLEKSMSKKVCIPRPFKILQEWELWREIGSEIVFFHITMKSDHTLHRCTMCVWLFHSVEEYRYYLMVGSKQSDFKCL